MSYLYMTLDFGSNLRRLLATQRAGDSKTRPSVILLNFKGLNSKQPNISRVTRYTARTHEARAETWVIEGPENLE